VLDTSEPWHAAQLVMPAWLNCALAKVLPEEGTSPAGAAPWQLSQEAVVGTWIGDKLLIVTGNTPIKEPATTDDP
jgi:hypothetical protein